MSHSIASTCLSRRSSTELRTMPDGDEQHQQHRGERGQLADSRSFT